MIAMTMPISTKTTIAACNQIQVGDMPRLYIRREASAVIGGSNRSENYHPRIARSFTTSIARPARVLLTLTLLAAASIVFTGGADAAKRAQPAASTQLDGVNILGVYSGASAAGGRGEIASAKALHAGVVRFGVPWSDLEPNRPGEIEPRALAYIDEVIGAAAAAKIKPIIFIDSPPCWASGAPAAVLSECVPGRRSQANRWPPASPAAYAQFVAYLAARYGTRLAAIEVWNEPDQGNELYFAGPEKARRYAEVLRAAYPAIKQADPTLPVLGGSFVGFNGVFLKLLYENGIKGYYDGLSVHFYTLTLTALREIHAVQVANGDTTPIWLDEFGWSSCWPQFQIQQEQLCVTAATQAANMTNLFRSIARTSWIKAALFYQMKSTVSENFGVLTEQETRKPSFNALARVFASPAALPPARPTLRLKRAGASVVALGSGPVGDYLRLEAFQGSTLRYRALFALNRFNQYLLTLPAALGTHGLRVRVYQLWQGSGRAVQRHI